MKFKFFKRLNVLKRFRWLVLGVFFLSFHGPQGIYKAQAQIQGQAPQARLNLSAFLPANLFVELAKKVNPTVVNISTTTLPKNLRSSGYQDPMWEMFEHFFGGQGFPLPPQQSLGTGFIIRKDGLIITNNHVIARADIIKVQLEERSEKFYEASVIGRDKRTDIALIKIKAGRALPTARLGSSKKLQVGEWVAAFGNPYGHGHTITKGIISAKDRYINEINNFPFFTNRCQYQSRQLRRPFGQYARGSGGCEHGHSSRGSRHWVCHCH